MKVPSHMIIKGSLVTNIKSGLKGVVINTDSPMPDGTPGENRLVSWSDGAKSWVHVRDLEWTDAANKETSNAMTFTSRYDSGVGAFTVGDIVRIVILKEIDYHTVAQLLNEAYKLGQQASVREFLSRVQQWSEEKGE